MTNDSMPTPHGAEHNGAAPGVGRPRAHVAWQLRSQAAVCAAMGSPLYALLLDRSADDVERGGVCWTLLGDHVAPGRGHALALRFLAAAHRMVLTGRAPALARHYPSVGGSPGASAWEDLRTLVEAERSELSALVALPCQTNEVGRSAALIGGFLAVSARTGLPLRLLEVGASAGLNLRWDRFSYGGGGGFWGPPDSPVDLSSHWRAPPPHTAAKVEVAERRGCDRAPVDPATEEGRLALSASVWADQPARLALLHGAIKIAASVPARLDRAPLVDWTATALGEARDRVATVVYHSVVEEYLPAETRAAFRSAVESAGRAARAGAPLAWLRLEPMSDLRRHELTLTTWPGGESAALGSCGPHGTDVSWSGGGVR